MQNSDTRTPKLKRNFSSQLGMHHKLSRVNNNSMSSLNSRVITEDLSSSFNRSFNPLRTVSSLSRTVPSKTPQNKKRQGTPIKVNRVQSNALADDEDDELIRSLTREIEELRAKRLSHGFYKKNDVDEEEEDNFETAFFAETLLGELGSSSGSHKDAFEDDDLDVLEGDSGASD